MAKIERITMAKIERTTDTEELERLFFNVKVMAGNMFRSARDHQDIWNRPAFISLEKRLNRLAEKLGMDDYDFGDYLC